MKKLLFVVILSFYMKANAQITLEHTYDTASTENSLVDDQDQLMIINFPVEGECYVRVNRVSKNICIYDMAHTLLKNISFASYPSNITSLTGDVLYISENLFSTDSKIAFIYDYNRNDASTPSAALWNTVILEEDGTVLFSDTGLAAIRVNYEQQQLPIYNTPVGTKMIISYRNRQAKVFSLPGKLAAGIEEANAQLMQAQSGQLSNLYPNPSKGTVTLQYQLPEGEQEGELILYNMQGAEVKRYKVDNTFKDVLIDNKQLPAGTYFYQLQTSKGAVGTKKMVVIK